MKRQLHPIWLLAVFPAVLYLIGRIQLHAQESTYFSELTFTAVGHAYLMGLRYDLLLVALLQWPSLLILMCSPLCLRRQRKWMGIWLWLSIGLTILSLVILIGDHLYFHEVKRHLGKELILMGNDWPMLLEFAFQSFLPVTLIGFLCITGLLWWLKGKVAATLNYLSLPRRWPQTLGWIAILPLWFLCVRGFVLEGKPLSPIDAFASGGEQAAGLALNGVHTALHESFSKRGESPQLMHAADWKAGKVAAQESNIYGWPFQKSLSESNTPKRNVVLIILESWGTQYIDALSHRGYKATPFMDSLIAKSTVYPEFYAAGQRSIHGIQGILTSIPVAPGVTEIGYGLELNKFTRMGSIAHQQGYQSLMVQTSVRRSFHMDGIAKALGFDHFYGQQDFPLRLNYPVSQPTFGWDYEGLQFFHEQLGLLNRAGKPLLGVFYSGTTHTPYVRLPKQFEQNLPSPAGESGFLNTLRYSDWSLSQFFSEAEKTPWYANTIFLITADHARHDQGGDLRQNFHIPFIVFDPQRPTHQSIKGVRSQYDILPTVLDHLGYRGEYSALGRPLSDTEKGQFALINKGNLMGYITDDGWILHDLNQRIEQKTPNIQTASEMDTALRFTLQATYRDLETNQWLSH